VDWGRLPHLLIWHGRRVCTARAPRCELCSVEPLCPSSRLERPDVATSPAVRTAPRSRRARSGPGRTAPGADRR
jgi:endonuclease-3